MVAITGEQSLPLRHMLVIIGPQRIATFGRVTVPQNPATTASTLPNSQVTKHYGFMDRKPVWRIASPTLEIGFRTF